MKIDNLEIEIKEDRICIYKNDKFIAQRLFEADHDATILSHILRKIEEMDEKINCEKCVKKKKKA